MYRKRSQTAIILCIFMYISWINAVSPPGPVTDLDLETQELNSAHKKCQSAALTRIDAETEKKLFSHQMLEPHEIEYHALCNVVELNLMKVNGEILVENVKKVLSHIIKDSHALENQLQRCTEQGPTAMQSAMHLFFCLHDAMMTHHELYSEARSTLFGPKALSYASPLNTAASEPNPNPPKPSETPAAGEPNPKPPKQSETPAAGEPNPNPPKPSETPAAGEPNPKPPKPSATPAAGEAGPNPPKPSETTAAGEPIPNPPKSSETPVAGE